MKIAISNINKILENRVRLGIMSALAVNQSLDFTSLKEFLDVTDGNLAGHLKALEKEEYISMTKSFIGKKPNTKYKLTRSGRTAFNDHLKALELIIKSQK